VFIPPQKDREIIQIALFLSVFFRNGMDSPYSYGIGCARLEVLSTNHREGESDETD